MTTTTGANVLPFRNSAEANVPGTAAKASERLQLDLAQRLALGTRLTELREERGLTQLEVAREALGFEVSHAAVSRLERGVLEGVEDKRLGKLAAFYGETVEGLLAEINGRQEEREPEEFLPVDGLTVAAGFGSRLFHMRQAAGLDKVQMAEKLGYVNGSLQIAQWEAEQVEPRPDTLLDVAVTMGVSASWLITGRRARPAAPTCAMRLKAMQKMYGVSNRDIAVLAGMDLERGPSTIGRVGRGCRPSPESARAVAVALDVPESWILPPEEGYTEPAAEEAETTRLSPPATAFLAELGQLFAMSAISDAQISTLRKTFLKELMSSLRPAKKAA